VFSGGLGFARTCADLPFQWDRRAPLDERVRQLDAATRALDPGRFGPFSVDAWVSPAPTGAFIPDLCFRWPAPTHERERPVPAGTVVRGVPALILSGEYDIGQPRETAAGIQRLFPDNRLVEIAASLHVTLFNAGSDCALTLIHRFLLTGDAGNAGCARRTPLAFPAVGRFARTSADLRPALRASSEDRSTATDRRLAAAAAATVKDAIRRAFIAGPTDHGRALRGGFVNTAFDDSGVTADLALAHFVEDVGVTGHARYDFAEGAIDANVALVVPGSSGQVQVRGVFFAPGASTLTVDGQIGGRRVVVSVPAT
jgi:hypothetical protein